MSFNNVNKKCRLHVDSRKYGLTVLVLLSTTHLFILRKAAVRCIHVYMFSSFVDVVS
jgi:hypothetical protein